MPDTLFGLGTLYMDKEKSLLQNSSQSSGERSPSSDNDDIV